MGWFVGLPLAVQIVIGVLFLLVVFGLGYIGKVNLKFGKNTITFGRQIRRTCGDCILVLMSKRERAEYQKNFISSRILKDQMNFAEQKLLEVQSTLLVSYREMLFKNKQADSISEENKQYRLYQGTLGAALMSVKDEIRRSFKENGFENLSGVEFTQYVRNKLTTLVAIGKDHINNLYPYEGMIVTIADRAKILDKLINKFEDMCFELFVKAKEIKLESNRKLKDIDTAFSKEIDEFLITK